VTIPLDNKIIVNKDAEDLSVFKKTDLKKNRNDVIQPIKITK
tara:strand:+ start:15320 stop:15445 length:126 start_codon:yes stop_codon:yes gene_type:complete